MNKNHYVPQEMSAFQSLMYVAKKCLRGVWPNFVNLPFYLSYKPTNYLLILMNEQVLYLSRIRKEKNKKNCPSLLTRFKVYPTESFS